MKSVLKIALAALSVLGLQAATLAMAQPPAPAGSSAPMLQPARPLGFQRVQAEDQGHPPIMVDIWYPTDAAPGRIQAGPIAVAGTANAPVAGSGLRLVVISHGTGGASLSHLDTAIALAEAGFVVAVPLHVGDNFRDDSAVGRANWLPDRSRQVSRVIDHMLGPWRDAAHLDGRRVGLFGFSAGATTALIAIGGEPDMARIGPHCAEHPEFACTLLQIPGHLTGAETVSWTHDPRIAAAVVAAPGFGFAFEPAGLANVHVPVQLWAGNDDQIVPFDTNTAVVRRLIPGGAELHQVPGARHLSFLTPCGAITIPALCEDSPGFDRAAFHRAFDAAVVGFFRARLMGRSGG